MSGFVVLVVWCCCSVSLKVVVCPQLTVKGVSFILGNDLSGGKVFLENKATSIQEEDFVTWGLLPWCISLLMMFNCKSGHDVVPKPYRTQVLCIAHDHDLASHPLPVPYASQV